MEDSVRYKNVQYNIHSILKQIENGRLVIQPEFREVKSWRLSQKSRFIESIILGMPAQPIWCEETSSGDYFIIDGSKRIEAIHQYVSEQFALSGLRLRQEYNGSSYNELPYYETLNIQDRVVIPFIVINYDTSPELKAEFYWRLFENEKSVKSQLARNFAYRDAYRLLKQLEKTSSELIKIQIRGPSSHGRSDDSRSTEIMLFLVLFATLAENRKYFDPGMTVEFLLDSLMAKIDREGFDSNFWSKKVLIRMQRIANHFGPPIHITMEHKTFGSGNFSVQEYFVAFIRAESNQFRYLTTTRLPSRSNLLGSATVASVLKFIEAAKND